MNTKLNVLFQVQYHDGKKKEGSSPRVEGYLKELEKDIHKRERFLRWVDFYFWEMYSKNPQFEVIRRLKIIILLPFFLHWLLEPTNRSTIFEAGYGFLIHRRINGCCPKNWSVFSRIHFLIYLWTILDLKSYLSNNIFYLVVVIDFIVL